MRRRKFKVPYQKWRLAVLEDLFQFGTFVCHFIRQTAIRGVAEQCFHNPMASYVFILLDRLALPLKIGKIVLRHMSRHDVPELTRISSKGQVVIPSRVRERLGLKAGSIFAVLTPRKGNVVVLKKVDSKSLQADLRSFREVERAWKEIERGQARRTTRKGFLEELETW